MLPRSDDNLYSVIAVEIPASLVLKCVGANILLHTMVILWGLTINLQSLVSSYQGLLASGILGTEDVQDTKAGSGSSF